jgi:hypothetical protein
MADFLRHRRCTFSNPNIRQILINNGIYHDSYHITGFVDNKPRNWEELLQAMQNPREEAISKETYLTYCQRVFGIYDDPSIIRLLFPILQGECNDPAQDGVEFTNLAPFLKFQKTLFLRLLLLLR